MPSVADLQFDSEFEIGSRFVGRTALQHGVLAAVAVEGPKVLAATQVAVDTIEIQFSCTMSKTAALSAAGSYTLTPAGGSIARTITGVVVPSGDATRVRIVVGGELTNGAPAYTVTVAGAVEDLEANALQPGYTSADVTTTLAAAPDVVSIVATAANLTRVRVEYTKAVKQVSAVNSDDALNPSNYAISGGITVASVVTVSSTVVDLTTSTMTSGATYTLTVSNVEDLSNNVVV